MIGGGGRAAAAAAVVAVSAASAAAVAAASAAHPHAYFHKSHLASCVKCEVSIYTCMYTPSCYILLECEFCLAFKLKDS